MNDEPCKAETLRVIDLMAGADGVVDMDALTLMDVSATQVVAYLASQFSTISEPLAALLKDGCGFGVVLNGETLTVIGLAQPTGGGRDDG